MLIKDGGRFRLASEWVESVRISNQLLFMQLLVVRQMWSDLYGGGKTYRTGPQCGRMRHGPEAAGSYLGIILSSPLCSCAKMK